MRQSNFVSLPLYKKKRWQQVNLVWSINKDPPKPDRAGQATNTRVWHVPQYLPTRLVKFEMLHNNVLQVVGALWRHDTGIPMGGPFSALCANVHTLWKIERAGKLLRDWGELQVSNEGYIFWHRGTAWFSLCQFRDNVLIAANVPPGAHTSLLNMACKTLSKNWNLQVLCPCLDAGNTPCVKKGLNQTACALGTSMSPGVGLV